MRSQTLDNLCVGPISQPQKPLRILNQDLKSVTAHNVAMLKPRMSAVKQVQNLSSTSVHNIVPQSKKQ
jgi:hypothetical protein